MRTWSKGELSKIAQMDDLHISPLREDGKTYGTPTWIWSVVVDDALYVRGYNGKNSRWYQAAMREKVGRITAASMTKEAPSSQSTERSTTPSMMPIARSTRATSISAR
jgi:hypothetical protein